MVKAAIIVDRDGTGCRPIFGVPAVRRLVLAAHRLGIDTIRVLGRDRALREVLYDLVPEDGLRMIGDETDLGRAADGLDLGDSDQLLIMLANHVIDGWSLGKLLAAGDGSDLYCAGHGLNCAEPVYLIKACRLDQVLRGLWLPGRGFPADPSCRGVTLSDSLPFVLTDEPKATDAAERSLVAALGASTASTDSFLSRSIHRRLSRPISRRLAKTAVTPNMFTSFHIAVGLAGAFFLAKGTYASQLAGALLFLASTILDGVDGELARLKLKESNFGHYLDIIGDNVVHVAVFLGIAFGLYRRSQDPLYLAASGLLLGGFGLCALSVHLFMGHAPGEQGSRQTHWLAALAVNRDFAYLVLLLALVNRLSWFLFGTTIGVYVFAVVLFILRMRQRPAPLPR